MAGLAELRLPLLMSGVDRQSARAQVHQRVEDVVDAWRDGVAMLDA
jgi:hypothetical protein